MVFTQSGKNEIRDWMVGSASTAPLTLAIGTDTTSAIDTDTALGAEVIRKSFSATSTSPFNVVFEALLSTVEATGSTTSEVGLFNSTTGTAGEMFVRNTFAPISKTSSIEIQFEQRVEIE